MHPFVTLSLDVDFLEYSDDPYATNTCYLGTYRIRRDYLDATDLGTIVDAGQAGQSRNQGPYHWQRGRLAR